MNLEKAREFYSAYYEGTLEAGLRQSLEQRMAENPEVLADYASFAATLENLSALAQEPIEAPVYLSDRIATRLEDAQAKRPANALSWIGWLRNIAFSGVAGLALFGAFLGIRSQGGGTGTAQLVPSVQSAKLDVKPNGPDVAVTYKASGASTVMVTSGDRVMQRPVAAGGTMVTVLKNPNAEASLFTVAVTGDPQSTTRVAVPGTEKSSSREGNGTVLDLARALAGVYRLPVRVSVKDDQAKVQWKFPDDTVAGAAASLSGLPYQVDQLENGMINLSDR